MGWGDGAALGVSHTDRTAAGNGRHRSSMFARRRGTVKSDAGATRGTVRSDARAAAGRSVPLAVSSSPMGSNRGFWLVIGGLVAGGILLVALVFAFRPFARSGAVAYAQSNLRLAASSAERHAGSEGSFAGATALALRQDPDLGDLLLIDPDTSSNDSEIVSVLATETTWTGAARADTGECFWIRLEGGAPTARGTGTDCSAEEASVAPAGSWPEP
jgi:hypothetical protein